MSDYGDQYTQQIRAAQAMAIKDAQQYAGAAQNGGYTDAAVNKTNISQAIFKEAAEAFGAIERSLSRVEGAANRLIGAAPQEARTESTASVGPGHHVAYLTTLVSGLNNLERRLRSTADRLESFI